MITNWSPVREYIILKIMPDTFNRWDTNAPEVHFISYLCVLVCLVLYYYGWYTTTSTTNVVETMEYSCQGKPQKVFNVKCRRLFLCLETCEFVPEYRQMKEGRGTARRERDREGKQKWWSGECEYAMSVYSFKDALSYFLSKVYVRLLLCYPSIE